MASIFEHARLHRLSPTPAEKVLWDRLQQKRLGVKFRRQHVVKGCWYIADFYSHSLKLVIEVDGEYHDDPDQQIKDMKRTEALEAKKCTVIRFTNEEVLTNLPHVISEIEKSIEIALKKT